MDRACVLAFGVALTLPAKAELPATCIRLPEPSLEMRERACSPTCTPVYPMRAIRERLEGSLVLEVTLAADGSVVDAVVAESSGHEILDHAAQRAVRAMRLQDPVPAVTPEPGTCYWIRLPVAFRFPSDP